MKARIRFSKTGALKYIGHLDVMRYFQKLFRRAQIPVSYSEGFSPHQILSFSHPLPLGMESMGEYADIELSDKITTAEAIKRLKAESVDEIEIQSFKEIPDKCENAMASVRASRYEATFENKCPFDLDGAVKNFMDSSEIVAYKKTKKSEKFENIRPFIFEMNVSKEKEDTVEMLISSGSINNLKPELVMSSLALKSNVSPEDNPVTITRIDQYTLIDDKFVSLDDIGCDFT